MNCKKCQEQLVDLLYGELSPRRRRAMEAHLKACPVCAKEFETMRATRELFTGLDDPAPPRTIETRIKATAQQEAERPAPASQWRILFHPAFATAVLAILAFGVVLFEMEKRPEPQKIALPELEKYLEAKKLEPEGLSAIDYYHAEADEATMRRVNSEKPIPPAIPESAAGKGASWKGEDSKLGAEVTLESKSKDAVLQEAGDRPAMKTEAEKPLVVKEIRDKEEPGTLGAGARPEEESFPKVPRYRHVVPHTLDGQLEMARDAMASENWERAKTIYFRSLQTMPRFEPRRRDAEFNLAVCLINLKQYPEAQNQLEKYIRDYPESNKLDQALFYLAEVYALQGQLAKAKATYQQIKERYPLRASEAQEKLEALKED
jgi:TolA-binding protein